MTQARRPAGVPTGGQFAPTNRPEARGLALVDDEGGAAYDPLAALDRDGARQAERIAAAGSICARLPAVTRRLAGESSFEGVEHLADTALRYSARLDGMDDESYGRLTRCLPSQMSTDIWRAARHHAREVLAGLTSGAPARPGDWVCPVDASHETAGGRCTTCGASEVANNPGTDLVPPRDAPEVGPVRPDPVAASGIPDKPERVLRELVSDFYRLQNEADEGNDDDMSDAFDRAAQMLDITVNDAFAGGGHGGSPLVNRIDIDAVDWTYCGDADGEGGEKAQMLGTVFVDSTPFHALALQVEDGDVQRALQRDDDLGMAMNALGDQSPYETVDIDGRAYVLLLSPHGR